MYLLPHHYGGLLNGRFRETLFRSFRNLRFANVLNEVYRMIFQVTFSVMHDFLALQKILLALQSYI